MPPLSEWDLRILVKLQPTLRQLTRYIAAREIENGIALGYSARGACAACGIPYSTGRRWLRWVRSLDDAQYSTVCQTLNPNDIPF